MFRHPGAGTTPSALGAPIPPSRKVPQVAEAPGRDALVIRFVPIEPKHLLRHAKKTYKKYGVNHVSVFADSRRQGETVDDLISRLLNAAELSGISASRNETFWYCSAASDLMDDGFCFVKDGYDGELDEHYSINLGNSPTIQDTERLAAHFVSRSWDK